MTHKIPTEDLVAAIAKVVEENDFTPLQRKRLRKKLNKAAKRGNFDSFQIGQDWAWRICAALLSLGKYNWFGWETRSQAIWDLSNVPWHYPRWDGRECDLYLVAEQGIGDEIVQSNAYADLFRANPRTTVECDSRLLPMFERSYLPFPHARFESRWYNDEIDNSVKLKDFRGLHDMFMPAGNALKCYRHTAGDWPGPWLCLDGPRLQEWIDRLAHFPRPHTGVSWTGRTADRQLEPFLIGGGTFFNLNYLSDTDPRVENLEWEDFDDQWHLIGALDRVFTTTNTTAHMAGSIGQHVRVLMPDPIYGALNNRLRWYYHAPARHIYPSMRVYKHAANGWGTAPCSSEQGWSNIHVKPVRGIENERSSGKESGRATEGALGALAIGGG